MNLERQRGMKPRSEYPRNRNRRENSESYLTRSPRLPYEADKSIYGKYLDPRILRRRKLKAAFLAVYYYFVFKKHLRKQVMKRRQNCFDYYNKHLSNIFKSITNFTLEAVNPAILMIAKIDYKLEFSSNCGLDHKSMTSNYYQAVDLAIEILVTMIEETISHMDKNEFITFLCKNLIPKIDFFNYFSSLQLFRKLLLS